MRFGIGNVTQKSLKSILLTSVLLVAAGNLFFGSGLFKWLIVAQNNRWRNVDGFALIGAIIICLIWFLFYWKLLQKKSEFFLKFSAAILMGMCSAIVGFFVIDLLDITTIGKTLQQTPYSLSYCILKIGFIEETIKLIPVCLMIRFFRQPWERHCTVILGGLSALGFATIENVLYLSKAGIVILNLRFWYSTLFHMTSVVLVSYCIVDIGRKFSTQKMLKLIGSFVAVFIIHGLFDFFLVGNGRFDGIFAMLIMLGMARIFYYVIQMSLKTHPIEIGTTLQAESCNLRLLIIAGGLLPVIGMIGTDLSASVDNIHQSINLFIAGLPVMICATTSLGSIRSLELRSSYDRSIERKSFGLRYLSRIHTDPAFNGGAGLWAKSVSQVAPKAIEK